MAKKIVYFMLVVAVVLSFQFKLNVENVYAQENEYDSEVYHEFEEIVENVEKFSRVGENVVRKGDKIYFGDMLIAEITFSDGNGAVRKGDKIYFGDMLIAEITSDNVCSAIMVEEELVSNVMAAISPCPSCYVGNSLSTGTSRTYIEVARTHHIDMINGFSHMDILYNLITYAYKSCSLCGYYDQTGVSATPYLSCPF